MKFKYFFTIVAAIIFAGCASSYQDRLDALNTPDGPPADKPADTAGDALMSRNDIPLSGACIINADCNSTQFCELGVCVSECGADSPCPDGQFCSARGRCVSDATYVDVDPDIKTTPPVDWYVDESIVQLTPNASSTAFNLKVVGGGSLQYRLQVEPADMRDSIAVGESEGVVASGGTKKFSVSVDRDAFGAGDHRIVVGIVSDGGQQNVIVEFSNAVEGRYAGFMDYFDPGLGRMPVTLDINVDDAGQIVGRIVTQGSLLFPDERGMSGQLNTLQKTLFMSASDRYEPDGEFDPFGRPIGREIYFYGELGEERVIKGTFEEVISGLLPQLFSATGEFYVKRTGTDTGTFTPPADPSMPVDFPPIVTDYDECAGFSVECNNFTTGFPANMVSCSTALRSQAYELGVDFSGVNSSGEPIVDFGLVEECRQDIARAQSDPAPRPCVNIDDLRCLRGDQQHYLMNVIAQDTEFAQYAADLNGYERLYAFMGNDKLVEAYRTVAQEISNPLTTELGRIEEALAFYENAANAFFEATNIAVIERATPGLLAMNNYEIFRVPLEYIRSANGALGRLSSLTLRKDISSPSKRETLRRRVQAHARVIYLESLALARLIKLHGGTFAYELAQLADELGSIGHTKAILDAGLNPLGYPIDYVPFIYDPALSQDPTNFSQLVTMAEQIAQSAVQKADAAEQAAQLMETRTEDIQRQITEIENSFESQIQQICGISSLDYIEECGSTGGDLAEAYSEIEQQYLEIDKIHQQIMDVNQMVKIKRDTAIQIMNIKNNTLVFMQANGAEMEALDIAEGEIRAAMLRKSGLFGAIGGILGSAAQLVSGDFAGAVASGINAGLGLASTAQSVTAAEQLAEVARRRTNLSNLEQMQLKQEDIDTSALQAAETVKLLLLQMASLNLDLQLADMRLAEKVIHANTLVQRVDVLMHQRDVLIGQALESVNNPLSNLSFRLNRDHAVLMASNEFEKALAKVYLAARGLEHELNVDLPQIESQLFQANGAHQLDDFLTCLEGWSDDYRIAFGSPHQEVTQISLREDVLGFTRSVTDEVTGEVIQPEEIFRRVLLDPKNITQSGRIEFPFVTSVAGESKSFSTLVCNDRIKSVRVMLVGDFLGDDEATVMLRQEGNSYLRDCAADPSAGEDILNTYNLDVRNALVQAGVNDFGLAQPNYDLTGRSVASDRWVLVIPTGAEAPNNKDIDLLNIDDVVIEITHEARTLSPNSPTNVFSQCNI